MAKPDKSRKDKRWRLIPSDLLAFAIIVLVLASMYFTNREMDHYVARNLQLQTSERIALASAEVTSGIRKNLKLVEGLGLALSLEPEISPQRFDRLAKTLLAS